VQQLRLRHLTNQLHPVREIELVHEIGQPSPLAAAIKELMEDSALAERLGHNGLHLAETITWPDTVDVLLGEKTAVQYSRTT